jgi:hypothetical protein
MLRRGPLVTLLWLAVAHPTSAQYLDYQQWESLSPSRRSLYIAGAIDSMLLFTDGVSRAHYESCILQSKLQKEELTENILDFVRSKQQSQLRTAITAMIEYLVALCGQPKR